VGVISSVTQAFCGDCNRARLSTEGRLYLCLFADNGYDLRGLLRAGASDQDLAKQKGTMPQDAYDQKVKALEMQVVAFQNRTQMAVRALEKSTDAAMAELMNAILTITGEIAAEMGANLVLPKQQVVLHEPRMDVTAQVIERLNRKLPTVNFPVPQVDDASSSEPPPSKSGKK